MNLLFVTQNLDARHPILGSVVESVRALGRRFERVTVIANEVGEVPVDLGADGSPWVVKRAPHGPCAGSDTSGRSRLPLAMPAHSWHTCVRST